MYENFMNLTKNGHLWIVADRVLLHSCKSRPTRDNMPLYDEGCHPFNQVRPIETRE